MKDDVDGLFPAGRFDTIAAAPAVQVEPPGAVAVPDPKVREAENVRLGHAIAILNHHAPAFGFRTFRGESSILAGQDEGEAMMSELPAELRAELVRAMTAAARFAARCFEES